ncbi:aspartic peptidase domain-containing protein [Mycena alexandri]|uniref:Aspartic peptidase domain-containing protein n=1 Tax=Mycena alexandri TaxID=1745969 RepID=A0AAD6THN3_9AGAR|nr:aspartic peptidase domain-containing protein [Mycena alexandri]
MYYSLIFSLLVSSVLTAVDVCANILPLGPPALVVPINRSFHQKPPVHSSSLPVCDVPKVQEECANMGNKYRDVQQKLQLASGIDLDIIKLAEGAVPEDEVEEAFIPPLMSHELPLKDYISDNLDMLYFGDVYMGTPPQKLTFDVDSGSADFWMPVNCSRCDNKGFDDTKSSRPKNSDEDVEYLSVSYGSGEVYGTLRQERVSVAGLEVPDLFFIAVANLDGDFNDLPNDGLMGFAFSSISESGKPTFFETLVRNGMLPAPMFSVHLTRHQETGSSLCFGGIDRLKTLGPVEWVPVLKETYWSVSMDAIVVSKNKEMTTDIIAIIDTGTTLIYLPDKVALDLYQLIGGRQAPEFGSQFYVYPCNTTPDIAFSFDKRRFSINPKDFNLGRTSEGSEDCVGGILALGSGFPSNLAIIGDEFMKSWYTTFDYTGGPTGGARVGFSPSINNS